MNVPYQKVKIYKPLKNKLFFFSNFLPLANLQDTFKFQIIKYIGEPQGSKVKGSDPKVEILPPHHKAFISFDPFFGQSVVF